MSAGVDLHCYYQRFINFDSLAAAKINGFSVDYGWVKVSDGGSAYSKIDGNLKYIPDTMVKGLKRIGRLVGGYHYLQLSPTPEKQAELLWSECERLDATDLKPACDLEDPFDVVADKARCIDYGGRFATRLVQLAGGVEFYSGAARMKVLQPATWGVRNLSIWCARYGNKPEAGNLYIGPYDVHQFLDDLSIAGTLCDANWAYNDSHLLGEDMGLSQEQDDRLRLLEQGVRTLVREATGDLEGDPSFSYDFNLKKFVFNGNIPGFPSQVPGSTTKLSPVGFIQSIDKLVNKLVTTVESGGIDTTAVIENLKAGLAEDLTKAFGEKLVN